MLNKLIVAIIASAFALGVYAQAPKSGTTKAEPATPAAPKGQTGTPTQKATPATPAEPKTKTAQDKKAKPKTKKTKDDAKGSRKDATKEK